MFSGFFQSVLGRASLISPDDIWALMTVLFVSVAFSIWLEQKYKWASKISGAIIALIIALILSNLAILPTHSAFYDDIIWGFAVPMGIPLLLLQANIKKIWKETGRMLIVYFIGAIGTIVGALLAFYIFKDAIPELAGLTAMFTGTYIGGSVNLAALASEFNISAQMVGSATVADNLLMAIYFFVLIFFSGLNFFRKRFAHPYIKHVEQSENLEEAETRAGAFWCRKEISLKDIANNLALSVAIVFAANLLSSALALVIPTSNVALQLLNAFFGSQYIWITTLAMVVATWGEEQVSNLNGSQEIGTFFIYLFLFVIGVPASIVEILLNTPLLFAFAALIVAVNMLFSFIGGKLLKMNLEDIILASNANIGGPTTAAGMAISQGWSKLVAPVMLIGTLGYVIGTYFGVIVGTILGA